MLFYFLRHLPMLGQLRRSRKENKSESNLGYLVIPPYEKRHNIHLPAIIRDENDTIESIPSYASRVRRYFARNAADPTIRATPLVTNIDDLRPSPAEDSSDILFMYINTILVGLFNIL